jgi:hypothetical protein
MLIRKVGTSPADKALDQEWVAVWSHPEHGVVRIGYRWVAVGRGYTGLPLWVEADIWTPIEFLDMLLMQLKEKWPRGLHAEVDGVRVPCPAAAPRLPHLAEPPLGS